MITFRPVLREDLPLLADWIARPHWQAWWGEVDKELGFIRDMLDGKDTTKPYIFQIEGRDVGYIQVWMIKDQLALDWEGKEPWLALLPVEAVGVDLSIGVEEDLGKGFGTRVLTEFVARLRSQGHTRILIDPDISNERAVKAYRKAGFRDIEGLKGRTGDCLIMEHVN